MQRMTLISRLPARGRSLFASAALLSLAYAAPLAAQAQPVYRIVGADGRVSFSDQPPPNARQARPLASGAAAGPAVDSAGLPYDLRQVVGRYPVTLYTATSCAPCDSGRALLVTRGIPFNERTVTSPEDVDALKKLGGDGSLPLLTIGAQQLRGYSNGEWAEYLDLAGYPKGSVLPAGYRRAAATPLVKPSPVASEQAKREQPSAAAPAPAALNPTVPSARTTPDNPAGIRF
jgi:hypothetical protein